MNDDHKNKMNTKNNSQKEESTLKYKSGIPTLRSSSHRVRHSTKKTQKNEPQPKRTSSTTQCLTGGTNGNGNKNEINNDATENCTTAGTMLPSCIREVDLIQYDMEKYNFIQAIIDFLHSLDSNIVGTFRQLNDSKDKFNPSDCTSEEGFNNSSSQGKINNINLIEPQLENFEVPISSLTKKSKRGILLAQDHLSQAMHDCFFGNTTESESTIPSQEESEKEQCSMTNIVTTFDDFVTNFIVPHLKQRLVKEQIVDDSVKIHFYYQRPPTLRIQPGPARARVNRHKDKDYGHQNGELNFWIPLTNRHDTGVDLYVESEEDRGDYEPLGTDVGHVSSFFGSGCSHYVNENRSEYTRVSLDFRVGIEPFYDPNWSKIGTRDDHLRRSVQM